MKTDRLSRRRVLRDALALGGSLSATWLLAGCDRPGPTAPAGPPPGPTTAPAPGAPAPTGKLPKANVQYQEHPNGEQQCARCQHFIAESSTCRLVEGPINPNGWCVLWVKKA